MYSNKNEACVLALAYPDFYIIPEKRWYMHIFAAMGMVKQGKISAGHAGLVIINKSNGHIKYADFGRYSTPIGKGRVRSMLTDPELEIKIKASFNSKGELLNLEEILKFFEARPDITEGVGPLFASMNPHVDLTRINQYVDSLAQVGSMPYNLTQKNSSNCARFVADSIVHATSDERVKYKFKHHYKPFLSPLGNVYSNAADQRPIYKIENGKIEEVNANGILIILRYLWFNRPNEKNSVYASKKGAYLEPLKNKVPKEAQWLGGFADGAWFELLDVYKRDYLIRKYSSKEETIFERTFHSDQEPLNPELPFQFTYDSNASKCSIIQNDQTLFLHAV